MTGLNTVQSKGSKNIPKLGRRSQTSLTQLPRRTHLPCRHHCLPGFVHFCRQRAKFSELMKNILQNGKLVERFQKIIGPGLWVMADCG